MQSTYLPHLTCKQPSLVTSALISLPLTHHDEKCQSANSLSRSGIPKRKTNHSTTHLPSQTSKLCWTKTTALPHFLNAITVQAEEARHRWQSLSRYVHYFLSCPSSYSLFLVPTVPPTHAPFPSLTPLPSLHPTSLPAGRARGQEYEGARPSMALQCHNLKCDIQCDAIYRALC